MTTTEIKAALDAQLQTISGLPALQTENTRLDASSNLAGWVRATIAPAQSEVISLGVGAMKVVQGLYQVDVFCPMDKGDSTARTLADAVVDAFPIGLRLVQGSTTVIVDIASVMTAYNVNKNYCIPVRVRWSVYG